MKKKKATTIRFEAAYTFESETGQFIKGHCYSSGDKTNNAQMLHSGLAMLYSLFDHVRSQSDNAPEDVLAAISDIEHAMDRLHVLISFGDKMEEDTTYQLN